MELTWHKTPSVFSRYDITDESDKSQALAKLSGGCRRRRTLGPLTPPRAVSGADRVQIAV